MAGRCGCQRTCACCTVASETIAVTGSGSAGQCFQLAARLSPSATNRLTTDGDGLLAQLCGQAPNGDQLALTPDGCLIIPPPVVLDYDGNPIPPNEDGEIPLPTGGLPPAYGCGLQSDEDGVLSVRTSGSWPGSDLMGYPFEGDASQGSEIYCDPITGELRGAPLGTAITGGLTGQLLAPTLLAVPGTYNSPGSSALTLTNPSAARSMLVARFVQATVDAVIPPQGRCEIRLQERIDGGSWATVREVVPAEPQGGSSSIRSVVQASSWRVDSIPPGDSLTLELRVQAQKTGLGDDDPVLVEANVSARLMGVSQ